METLLITILILNIFQNCVEAKSINGEDNDVPNFRIFNGEEATAGQFPYQVALKQRLLDPYTIRYATFCGGSIISESKVLSAAHCFTQGKTFWEFILNVPAWRKLKSPKTLFVVAGSLTNQQTFTRQKKSVNSSALGRWNFRSEQWIGVRKVKVLDKQYGIKLDVAVVILRLPYKFNTNVAPIPLATGKKSYDGLKCLASGYGQIGEDPQDNKKEALSLQWAQLTVVPTAKCSKEWRANTKKFVCTENKDSDVRPGDSGGPLVCFDTGEPNEGDKGILVGIACAIYPGKPSIFTRVTDYIDFINK